MQGPGGISNLAQFRSSWFHLVRMCRRPTSLMAFQLHLTIPWYKWLHFTSCFTHHAQREINVKMQDCSDAPVRHDCPRLPANPRRSPCTSEGVRPCQAPGFWLLEAVHCCCLATHLVVFCYSSHRKQAWQFFHTMTWNVLYWEARCATVSYYFPNQCVKLQNHAWVKYAFKV